MEVFFGVTLIGALAAVYCASLFSRLLRRRGKRPGWIAGGASIILGTVVEWLFLFQLDLFRPSRWYTGKVDLPSMLLVTGFFSFIACTVPSAWMIERHQKLYDKTHPS
jgi:Na+/proline symporter